MKSEILQFFSDRPLLGFTGSLLTISITDLQLLQIIGAILGIVIAVITSILKVIELYEKLAKKREEKRISRGILKVEENKEE